MTIEQLNARFYVLCRLHGILPPVGPVLPPDVDEPEAKDAA